MSLLALVTPAAESEADRWQRWHQHYVDSSRKTTTQMRLVFAVMLITVVGFLLRALLL